MAIKMIRVAAPILLDRKITVETARNGEHILYEKPLTRQHVLAGRTGRIYSVI